MSAAEEDLASGLLWECGTRGLQVVPAPDGGVALLAYFDADPEIQERLTTRLRLLPGARVEPAVVPDVDWLARAREGFRPFEVGPFEIRPAWEAEGAPAARTTLVVDPGRAFGTGGHETTRLCLRALARVAAERSLGRVLDLGAGTGILALAALRLGARSATAVDIDPEAIDSAQKHAILNQASLAVVLGDGPTPFLRAIFDLILANVSAPLLLKQSVAIVAAARPGASAILSGFLTGDVDELSSAYGSAGSLELVTSGEWAALIVRGLREP